VILLLKRLKKISIIPAFLMLCISHGITAQDTLSVKKPDKDYSADTLRVEKSRKQRKKDRITVLDITNDTVPAAVNTVVRRRDDTMKATMLAAALPGAGQIYNSKYWKIPIVYAGFGALIYFYKSNTDNYQMYYRGYLDFTDKIKETASYIEFAGDPTYYDPVLHPTTYSPANEQLVKEKMLRLVDYHKRYRDLSVILTGVWYFAQILDANVDASLSNYDVTDNLQLSFYPSLLNTPGQMTAAAFNVGLKMTF